MNTGVNATSERTEIVLPGRVEPDGLLVRTVPTELPAAGHVRLEMEATGVSFAEQQMRRGKYYDQPPFPFVPGYDLVGMVRATGAGVDAALVGRRFAAVTKTGAWSSQVEVDAGDLLAVPNGIDPVDVETLTVNGITAWQMLHDIARVPVGGTIVVLGANGGVGSTLVQLAKHAGIRVIGTASTRHHEYVRELGAEPVDSRDPELYKTIRALVPGGVDAVFDHVGGEALRSSWALVRPGGILVSYGSASTMKDEGNSQLPMYRLFARLLLWNLAPNGKRAHFYNFWAGRRRPASFRAAKGRAFDRIVALLGSGHLVPQIAARFRIAEATEAMRLAESGTVTGKVVLLP
ncbi:medium chain dehydrogenase/reductase family protein [Plantibacter sp. YIM 135249]|uniref:medium chain dehydrogenase/reductase family protein n=1 Tax=Plantibacter sp. YIM 135249 TaxID=3423918 RepID=UPI003D34AFC8